MTAFDVSWGGDGGATGITTAAELDRVLDGIVVGPGRMPYSVAIYVPDESDLIPVMLEIGIGHPERSFAFYVGEREADAGWAHEPGVPEGDDMLVDHAGQATDVDPFRTRVTVAGAREAARRFVASGGRRPTNLEWYTKEWHDAHDPVQ